MSEDESDALVADNYVMLSDMHAAGKTPQQAVSCLMMNSILAKENPMKRRKKSRARRNSITPYRSNPIGLYGAEDGTTGGFVQNHPWMTFFIVLTGLSAVVSIATGKA